MLHEWQSSYATDCRSVYPGANPGSCSTIYPIIELNRDTCKKAISDERDFSFAIPAGDLSNTERFYVEVLGCATGNREVGRWVDIDFWGNELTLHQSTEMLPSVGHDVDMGKVQVPHFGVHLSEEDFQRVKIRIEDSSYDYLQEPYRRFIGTEFEQETFSSKILWQYPRIENFG